MSKDQPPKSGTLQQYNYVIILATPRTLVPWLNRLGETAKIMQSRITVLREIANNIQDVTDRESILKLWYVFMNDIFNSSFYLPKTKKSQIL